MNIHDKINARALIKEFASISERELKARIQKLKIRSTGQFEQDIRVLGSSGSDGLTVQVFYNYYGIFVQHGLGKGIAYGDQGVSRMIGKGRKPKKWMTGVGHIRNRLAEIYEQEIADGMESAVADSLEKSITFKL